jgi:hypothetical protein
MKKFTLLVAICAFSSVLFAKDEPKTTSRAPKAYVMMKHGKLIEVNKGQRKVVNRDITLINESTIHPNGSIDASSGQSLQLKEGEYMTMDGRIRKLKDMPRSVKKKKKKKIVTKCSCKQSKANG